MHINILFILILFSYTLFLFLKTGIAFEKSLPLVTMGIALITYFFGLADKLYIGFVFITFTAILLGGFSLSNLFHSDKADRTMTLKKYFSPGLIIFIVFLVILHYIDYQKLADADDEFSHWMITIKDMTIYNDFTTTPQAYDGFKAYPPIMALFQYFFQEIVYLFRYGEFSEWRMYVAYHVFALSLIFPVFSTVAKRQKLLTILSTVGIMIVPLIHFFYFYNRIYIDPFVGIAAGCGFGLIIFGTPKTDNWERIYIAMLCAVLVLAKDVGLYFSIFISICYVIKSGFCKKGKYGLFLGMLPLLSTLLAKISWQREVIKTNAYTPFQGQIDWIGYTKIFFFGGDPTYRQEVVDKYKLYLTLRVPELGNFGVSISWVAMLIVYAILTALLFAIHKKKEKDDCRARIALPVLVLIAFIGYIYFLGAVYISRFTEYEARILASYDRYLSIVYLALSMVVLFGILSLIPKIEREKIKYLVVLTWLGGVLLLTPFQHITSVISRENVRISQIKREPFWKISDVINDNCYSSHRKILLVSSEDVDWCKMVVSLNIMPNRIVNWVDAKTVAASDLEKLVTPEVDYIAIYKIDNDSAKKFSELFTNNIDNNSLYYREKSTGKFNMVTK